MKTKLILGALSVVIAGAGTFTVSALQSQPEPSTASQSSHSDPNVNKPAISVDVTARDVNEKPTDPVATPQAPKVTPAPKTHTIPASIGYGGTPLPAVEAMPAQSKEYGGGYDNMCIHLVGADRERVGVDYTTVIISNYDPSDPNLFPYLGDIDVATGAPATAVGSQQWCADHDPTKVAQ